MRSGKWAVAILNGWPYLAGPFVTAEEQKAHIRARSADGAQWFWLDVDRDGTPSMGRVADRDLPGGKPI